MRGRFVLLTAFGLGHMRPFPGTWGSAPPVLLAGVLIGAGLGPAEEPVVYHALLAGVVLLFSGACIVHGDHAEARFLSKDPSHVVADEMAGQSIALMALPAAALATPLLAAFTLSFAFLAFRVCDIVKPWPSWRLQLVPGGWGILLDDLFAGFYALVIVQVVARVMLVA